jgi:hypothetical protein
MGALLDNPGCQGATRPVSTASLRTHGGVPCGPQIKVDSGQASANGNIEFLLAENGQEIFRAEFQPKDAGNLEKSNSDTDPNNRIDAGQYKE